MTRAGERRAGANVGPFVLVEQLGAGGMGTVWRARQESPIAREVAVKLAHADQAGRTNIERLLFERAALARMDHPHIARIYEAGVAEDGRPYLAMEFVRGAPVTEWCEKHALELQPRLRLMSQICRAVHHAHQRGVLHRDLKPSNVMVRSVDEAPVPVVIDFGLGKPFGDASRSETLTQAGEVLGTPAYMSPEQAAGGDDVDVRTDVYALGVLLYELMTGDVPFGRERIRKSGFLGALRLVLEEDPEAPSRRVSSWTTTSVPEDTRPPLEPARLAPMLRGDLDWIVGCALDRDRERRYTSAGEFADDIDRHLRHEPVEAGPPGTAYRLRKFVRRHGTAVAASTVVFLALVAGLAVSLSFGQRAREAAETARVAEGEARAAEREASAQARRAQVVRDHLRGMLGSAAPGRAGRDVRVADVLIRASVEADRTYADEPLLRAEIHHVLADTWFDLGDPEHYDAELRVAWNIRRDTVGPDHPDTLRALAGLVQAPAMREDWEEATRRGREALPRIERVLGPRDEAAFLVRHTLAVAQADRAPEDSVASLRAILEHEAELSPEMRLQVATSLAGVLASLGQHGEAEATYGKAAEELRRRVGVDDERTLEARAALATFYMERRRNDDAAEAYRELREDAERVLGPDHPESIAAAHNLAVVLSLIGRPPSRLEEAVELSRSAFERGARTYGLRNPETIASLRVLGQALLLVGRLDEAEQHLERAVRLYDDLDHPRQEVARLLAVETLAQVMLARGDRDEAEPLIRQVHGRLVALLPPSAAEPLNSTWLLANVLRANGRGVEALALCESFLARAELAYGSVSVRYAAGLRELAQCQLELRRVDEAVGNYERARDMLRETEGEHSPVYHGLLVHLAALYAQTGRVEAFDENLRLLDGLLEEAIARDETVADTVAARATLWTWVPVVRPDQAVAAWRKVVDLRARAAELAPSDPAHVYGQSVAYYELASVLLAAGDLPGALAATRGEIEATRGALALQPHRDEWRAEIVQGLAREVQRLEGLGKPLQGVEPLREAARELETLIERQSPEARWSGEGLRNQRLLARVHEWISRLQIAGGQSEAARPSLRQALAAWERILERAPESAAPRAARDVAAAHQRVAEVEETLGSAETALGAWREALQRFLKLAEQDEQDESLGGGVIDGHRGVARCLRRVGLEKDAQAHWDHAVTAAQGLHGDSAGRELLEAIDEERALPAER